MPFINTICSILLSDFSSLYHLCTPSVQLTFLYSYSLLFATAIPAYASLVGCGWLEKGGVYVTANIRGGGEFGPSWHQAAKRENRQKVTPHCPISIY